MVIGVLSIEVTVPCRETIKERRNRIRSIKESVRKKFNVGVSEVEQGVRSVIAVVAVSNETNYLNSVLSNLFNHVEKSNSDIIISYKTDFFMHE